MGAAFSFRTSRNLLLFNALKCRKSLYIFIGMFRLPTLLVSVLLCSSLSAQIMPFKNYGIKDGLIDNNVQAIARDDRGLLWIGTDFGISWFDGKRFFQPKIKTTVGQLYVTGFYKDWHGTMWVTTFYNGIYKFDGKKFINYLVDPALTEATVNSVSGMTQIGQSQYLVENQNTPYIFDGRSFRLFDAGNPFLSSKTNSILQLPDKTILLGTDQGIFHYRINNGRPLYMSHFARKLFVSRLLFSENRVCVLTGKGISLYPPPGATNHWDHPQIFFANKPIREVTAGPDGSFWAIADNGSFWDLADTVFRLKGGKISIYSNKNGLAENVQQIYCDNEGLIWFANRKGVGMLGDEFYEFNKIIAGHYSNPVTTVAIDGKNNLWAGTIDGLVQKKNEGYGLRLTMGRQRIGYVSWLKTTRSGRTLAGTVAGVLSIQQNALKVLFNIPSTAISEDAAGNLWFGGINGELWKYDGKSLKTIKIPASTPEMITAMQAADNVLWLGYRDKGILKYKITGDSVFLVNTYGPLTGYPDMRIRCSTSDGKGHTFWGTRTNGVFIFGRYSDRPLAHINNENGLTANWVRDVFCNSDSSVYLATNNGVNVIAGNYRSPSIKKLQINDDNINRETNCIVKDRGLFYIGTNEGILKWMPGNIHRDTVPPPVYLTKIDIQGLKAFSIDPYTLNAGRISLPYDKHFISFEFAGISLKSPENVSYRYMLTGLDKYWGPLTNHNDVSYDLRPGTYTFKVAAKNADGVWSRNPAVFHFIIFPPFWQSWWFISICLLAFGAIVYGAYQYKLSKMIALQALRNKISTDLHDDIGSTLSSISILSEVAVNEKEKRSKMMLAEINERSHLLMEKMDDIVWSISTRNDTIGNLFSRLQQFAATVLEAKDINYEVRIPEKVKNLKVDMQRRQHIYLIIKEAINNLIKYACCSNASIVVEYTNGILKVEVADDGKGFDTERESPGNGLLNMKKRARALHGKLNIASSPGAGTRVCLAVEID